MVECLLLFSAQALAASMFKKRRLIFDATTS